MDSLVSSDKFNALINAAVDGIFIIDSQGIIEVANQAVEHMLGYRQDEMVGHNIGLLMPSPDRERHDDYLRKHLETGEANIIGKGREVEALTKDGSRINIYLSVGKYDGGDAIKFVGIIHDLSSLKKTMTELEHAETEIHDLVNRLAHSSRVGVMGELAASIAHEINQPLTAISTYAQAASRFAAANTETNKEVTSALEKIGDQALRAGEIIRSLRTWIREQDTKREACNANLLINEVADIVRMEAQNNDVQLQFKLDPDLPTIVCDPVQIQQVVLNLIKNAIDALSEVTPSPVESDRSVLVSTQRVAEDRVKIAVSDHGPGITDSNVQKLFDPFFSTKKSGMGMGLSICRTIIRAHGGDLDFEPNTPTGASFYFILPTSIELT